MNYNFINEIYLEMINGLNNDETLLASFVEENDNSFILNHNNQTIVSLLNFLKSNENVYVLNGFMGAGKTYTIDFVSEFIDPNVLVFKNSYQEAINLDDVLLSLFKDFSIYHNEGKIDLPKVDTPIFYEKINAYIKNIDLPMLFIFDSLEINMRSQDTQKDILDFINYLSRYEKIKVIICSRTFKQEDLLSTDSSLTSVLSPITKEEMIAYLSLNNITGSNFELEELYKTTRGHYLLLELSVLIIKLLDTSLTLFFSEYKKTSKNFLEFVISKLISLSAERFLKPLILLSAIRHSVPIDFLEKQNFATTDDLSFLLQKHLVAEKNGRYYLKDYVKNEFSKSINIETKIKIHRFLKEAYEAELPLKPFERILFLSRQTMRQEIAYHEEKIKILESGLTKAGKTSLINQQELSYLTYTKTRRLKDADEVEDTSVKKRYIEKIKRQSNKSQRFELSKEDTMLLNSTANDKELTKQFEQFFELDNPTFELNEPTEEKVPDTLDEFLEIAQNYENAFNYSNAILYYKKALTYKFDINFSIKEPIIYTKLAICYKKIQDIDEAVRIYEKVFEIYASQQSEKANEILLSMAEIYNETYKFDKAIEVYNRILYSPVEISDTTKIRVYLDLAEIENNNLNIEKSAQYIQRALSISEKNNDIKLLTECYFKYALILDDVDNIDMAQKYYLRCIQASNNPEENLFLSSAYSNLAEISTENNNYSAAKMYYDLAAEADKTTENYEGMYFSYMKLASLYKAENSEKVYENLIKALSAAKKFDDISYAISVYVEIGDYYVKNEVYKHALKAYLLANSLATSSSSIELKNTITSKLNKLKLKLGEANFTMLITEIKNKE